jgi:hypothetical protein
MSLRKYFPSAYWICRTVTGRIARRIYLTTAILLLIAATAPRIRSMLMARRIHAVLAGMEKVKIDQTTESQLVKVVPYLVRSPYQGRLPGSAEDFYAVEITNEPDWEWLVFRPAFTEPVRMLISKVLDWCGYRYMRFNGLVVTLDGKVSSIGYGISPQLGFPRPVFDIVSVQSVHGFWAEGAHPLQVDSVYDESPQFRVTAWKNIEGGPPSSVHVTYTADAASELTSGAFRVNLNCFWSLRGCTAADQMTPQLLQEKTAIEAKAASRLSGSEPCPAWVLSGRVRYLLDEDVLLLQVKKWHTTNRQSGAFAIDYEVKEVIRGRERSEAWEKIQWKPLIYSPVVPQRQIDNPVSPPKPGEQVLFFGGEQFLSCEFVPASATGLAAIREAVPAARRREDQISLGGLQ